MSFARRPLHPGASSVVGVIAGALLAGAAGVLIARRAGL